MPTTADTVPAYPLYYGACGVIWALRYLQRVGAARLHRSYASYPGRQCLRAIVHGSRRRASSRPAAYLMGETSILMLMYWDASDA